MRNKYTFVVLACAAIVGTAIGYLDSRPTWDDTGITVGAIFLAAAILAALRPRSAWLAGFLVGFPVLAFNVISSGRFDSAVALVIGLLGAGLGRLVGGALDSGEAKHPA